MNAKIQGRLARVCAAAILILVYCSVASWSPEQLFSRATASDLEQRFDDISGEHWYRLQYRNRSIGAYLSRTYRDENLNYQFYSRLSFTLPGAEPVTVEQQISFDADPPHALAAAWLNESNPAGGILEVTVQSAFGLETPTDKGRYRARIQRNGDQRSRMLGWQYDLATHLALESWLHERVPGTAAVLHTVQLDLEQLRLKPLSWRLVSRNPDGYVVRNSQLPDDTVYQLDAGLVPESFTLGGLFELYRVPEPVAVEELPDFHRVASRILLDKPLQRPHRLKRLVLEINEAAARALKGSGADIQQQGKRWIMQIDSDTSYPMQPADAQSWLQEEVLYPINHPRIRKLASKAQVFGESDSDTLARLTSVAYEQLRYAEDTAPITVLDALTEGAGDCTEFADLLTTLARAAGLPARTVTGLAYYEETSAEGPQSGFALHSWSEVVIDGNWVATDPTWNQLIPDATHIPFPRTPTRQLLAIASIPEMRFKVISAN